MTSKYSESPVALMSCFTDLVCKVAARTHAYDLLPPREVEETGKWKEACVKKHSQSTRWSPGWAGLAVRRAPIDSELMANG